MLFLRIAFLALVVSSLLGCGDSPTEIPTTELTQEQKDAVKAEDAKVADEESHGTNKKKK